VRLSNPCVALAVEGNEEILPLDGLIAEFDKNEARADLAYLNKTLTVTVQVKGVSRVKAGKDENKYYVYSSVVISAHLRSIKLLFTDPKDVAPLNKDDVVTIRGKCLGFSGDLIFDECVILKQNKAK